MKNILRITALAYLVTLVSCGQNITKEYRNVTVVEESETFEGRYNLSNNSYIELFQSGDKVLFSTVRQLLTTVNPQNDTYGELPKINGEYVLLNNSIKLSKNINYTAGMDIEEDVSGSNILGKKRTDIEVKKVNGKLQVTYKIYSDQINSNANFIIATRTLVQE